VLPRRPTLNWSPVWRPISSSDAPSMAVNRVISSPQLRVLADIGERYSRKFGHITTRQNIQFHFVKLHDVEPAMRMLEEVGVTTREA